MRLQHRSHGKTFYGVRGFLFSSYCNILRTSSDMSSSLKTSSLAKFVTSNITPPRLPEQLEGNIGKYVVEMKRNSWRQMWWRWIHETSFRGIGVSL